MIKEIQAQFHDALLAEIALRYGLTAEDLQKVGGFESFVYQFSRDGHSYILKITHTIRRSENYIMGELEYLNFLAENGVSVARAVPSANGKLIERIPAQGDDAWLVICYAKAPGRHAQAADWHGEFFAAWGRAMGQIHRVTKGYRLSNPAFKRQEWYEEDQLNARKYLPASEAAVIAKAEELMAQIRALPITPDGFGLLHTDMSHGNLYWDEGRVTVFDFDDCGYNWFISDIAVALCAVLFFPPAPYADQAAMATTFLTHFLRGYREENELDPQWLPQIREFIRLRDLLLFIVCHQSFDIASWGEEALAEFAEQRNRILEGRALVELDWMQFA